MGWFSKKDDREERKELNTESIKWNKELDDREVDGTDKSKLMNKNYNAHIGKTAQEQRDENVILDNSTARHTWTKEQLQRETRLESKQRSSWKDTSDGKEAVEKAEEVIKDKKGWFW